MWGHLSQLNFLVLTVNALTVSGGRQQTFASFCSTAILRTTENSSGGGERNWARRGGWGGCSREGRGSVCFFISRRASHDYALQSHESLQKPEFDQPWPKLLGVESEF